MRFLLDVNVLLALLDSEHVHHGKAMSWLRGLATPSWASCPTTQNGFIRIVSHSGYRQGLSVQAAVILLSEACGSSHHQFWPDDLSLLDAKHFDRSRLVTSKQLTDIYLLALAVMRGGCLVTLDTRVSTVAVPAAKPENLLVL